MSADNATVLVTGNTVSVAGIADNVAVTVYDLAGRAVAQAKGESTFTLAQGIYIVNIHGVKTVKVML